jgi:predicted nucleic acid-binding Zn ribbon protein
VAILYDFKCKRCRYTQEYYVNKDQAVYCEGCKRPMIKVLSAPKAFILKGQGFYKPSKQGE